VSTAPQRLTDGDSGCVQRLQYLRHDHSCIGVVTEPAWHLSVRPAQQRIWWCTSRPKLPFLPQRGEAQAWSLAKPVQTPMAGFKPLSQESNRASSCPERLLSSSPRPPSKQLPTFKSACDLGKQESEHTAVIDMPEQQSETTIRTCERQTARLVCNTIDDIRPQDTCSSSLV